MARVDPQILVHQEWLDFIQPTGLVVSPTALVRAGAILDRNDRDGQRLLETCVEERIFGKKKDPEPYLPDFETFARKVLGWSFKPAGYVGTPDNAVPEDLEHFLPEYQETLRPDYAVKERDPKDDQPPWQLLVRVLEPGQDLDRAVKEGGQLESSPHSRMERLLREKRILASLLFNGRTVRLLVAPRGESSGWADFRVSEMMTTAGRPIVSAMRLLLKESRLLTGPREKRLTALLEESRKYQNEVSERLAEQVLHALYELLRGFQAAHDATGGELLREALDKHPDQVYRSLLTVILRLVFLLYSEERDLLPQDEVFVQHYSLAGLSKRLREDAAQYPDTMDQRFGAWAQLLTLFRLVYDGAECGAMKLPRRHGVLFDPDRYPFLEGRPLAGGRQQHERIEPPLVPDGTIHRALEKLLVLDGERLSYRALDVEQIGSVYETMMGFRLEKTTGRSVAIKAQKKHGAPTAIDLEALLEEPGAKRKKWVQDRADRKLTDKVNKEVKAAETLEELHAALRTVIDRHATPDIVPPQAMVLQPSEERRKSGSHYTPRALTEPIVRTTLEPIFEQLREKAGGTPKPEQILDLKVCDPAMGSGAFLVEACRQLAEALIESWAAHGERPEVPPDEDEVVYARRLVAQRCLYGVDRNPVAVDLAKVSLWLVTLAKDHALTFLDHALRHGDSLVGLSRLQIEVFHWDTTEVWESPFRARMRERLTQFADLRRQIREAGEDVPDWERRDLWNEAQSALRQVRLFGDLVLAAFFEGKKPKEREANLAEYKKAVISGEAEKYSGWLEDQRQADPPLVPFHWEIELPEVFERENPGFDACVGNPPFGGHVSVVGANLPGYTDWLRDLHVESTGKCDVVAHFFRRGFNLLTHGGDLGLIATNTIGQGDTRSSGLQWICLHGGEIFEACKRVKWPGLAAVVVSVIHVMKGIYGGKRNLDGRPVETITAFLAHRGGHEPPARLAANSGKSFQGSIVLGMGFTFDDTDKKGVASSLAEMKRLIERNPRNGERIFPYIGGEEVNTSPTQSPHRYVINFGEMEEPECRERWPDLMAILEEKVKPERLESARKSKSSHGRRAEIWWQHYHGAHELHAAIAGLERVLAIARVGQRAAITFLNAQTVLSESLVVFPFDTHAAFCALQARPHEVWARFFGSSMKDDLRYTPSDCFETFPFPEGWETHPALEAAGKTYYEFRADLMVRNDEGLTKTYNRFHDPEERDPAIQKLRDLHAEMDRAVLIAYGWDDIPTDCEFILDYEIDEENWGRRKKPTRYRWPDEVQDEVLGRLLELNAQRAQEEARSGLATQKKGGSQRKKASPAPQEELF
ncbi:MAG: N-6 DNA methylase [Planctomycetota bacterium]